MDSRSCPITHDVEQAVTSAIHLSEHLVHLMMALMLLLMALMLVMTTLLWTMTLLLMASLFILTTFFAKVSKVGGLHHHADQGACVTQIPLGAGNCGLLTPIRRWRWWRGEGAVVSVVEGGGRICFGP